MPYLPSMKNIRYILMILLVLLGACSRRDSIKGVYVILQNPEIRQRYGGEMGALADALKEARISMVVSPVFEHGTAYYPSDVFPRRWDYGTQLLAFRHELRRRNIRFAAHIPLFTDAYTYRAQPHMRAVNNYGSRTESETWNALCPSDREYQDYKIRAIIEIMLILQPDMIYLDDLHFPLNTADISGEFSRSYCFCPGCLQKFEKNTGITLPHQFSTADIAAKILHEHEHAWMEWKCEVIADFLSRVEREIHNAHPECRIMVSLLPLKYEDNSYENKLLSGQDTDLLYQHSDIFVIPRTSFSVNEYDINYSAPVYALQSKEQRIIAGTDLNVYLENGKEQEFQRDMKRFRRNIIVSSWDKLLKNRTYMTIFSMEP